MEDWDSESDSETAGSEVVEIETISIEIGVVSTMGPDLSSGAGTVNGGSGLFPMSLSMISIFCRKSAKV